MTKVSNKKAKMQPADERAMRRWRIRRVVGCALEFALFRAPVIAGLGFLAWTHAVDGQHVGGWQGVLMGYTTTASIPTPAVRPALPAAYSVDAAAKACLAMNGFHEARGEVLEGEFAVMIVTQTRTQKGWRGAEHDCDATLADKQFSWANALQAETQQATFINAVITTSNVVNKGSDEAVSWQRSDALAEKVLRGGPEVQALRDQLAGADHYYAEYIETPRWAHHPKMKFVTQIGLHKFYRWDG